MKKSLLYRLLFGVFFSLLIWIILTYSHTPLGIYFFLGTINIFLGIAIYEFSRLCAKKNLSIPFSLLLIFSTFYIWGSIFFPHIKNAFILPGIILYALHLFTKDVKNSLSKAAITIFSWVYITIPFLLMMELNYIKIPKNATHSSFFLIFLLIVTKGSDIFAYIGGKLFGKHPLCKKISPKKTIEGAIAGIFMSGVLSIMTAFSHEIWYPTLSPLSWVLLGILLSGVTILGDLIESLFKRDAEIKDSSSIPGLGGILDLVDSLLLTAPFLYCLLQCSGVISV